jgi:hypothetical protein
MAGVVSKSDVCNLALNRLGVDNLVVSIDDPKTEEEVICSRWYDPTRRWLLREHVWNFAKTRTSISRVATPAFGYEDAYQMPNDLIKFLDFMPLEEGDLSSGHISLSTYPYEIEGDRILLNNAGATTLKIIYTKDVTDVSKFDDLFIESFSIYLAKNMSYKFTLSTKVLGELRKDLENAKLMAKAMDGQERPPKRVQKSKFLRARRRLRGDVASPYTILE